MVVSELRGEKIDIIPWNTEPARFIAKALSPARVREVFVDDETKEATVIVPDDQLALAIGKEGLNARLATRLCGWKIDIQSESEFAQAEAEAAFAGDAEGEEYSGRCAAILSNGKRCPNAALPGSPYCGVPAHQALATAEPAGSNGDGELDEGEPEKTEVPEAVEESAAQETVAEAEIAEAEDVALHAVAETPEAAVEIAEAEEVATEAVAVASEPESAEPAENTAPEDESRQDVS